MRAFYQPPRCPSRVFKSSNSNAAATDFVVHDFVHRPAFVKVLYRQTANDDIVRQFRYYLLTADAPEIAVRFREAVKHTIQSLAQNPHVGPKYSSSNPRIQNLRSWPVAGFEAIRIYYALEKEAMHIIRILHGKRDIRRILQRE